MGSRNIYRIVSPHAKLMSNQRALIFEMFTTSRKTDARLFASLQEHIHVPPKVSETKPSVIVPMVSGTHSSTALIPPQKEDGLKFAEQPEEQTLPSTSTELPNIEPPLLAPPVEIPMTEESPGEDISASSSSPQAGSMGVGESSSIRGSKKSSIDRAETAKFAAIAATWWDYRGPYRPLHIMNPTRVSYIRSALCNYFRKDAGSARPLEGLEIVDVGCGGGLVCEPLARMGGQVTGVDAVERNIGVASVHAARDPATSSINYLCTTAEQLVQEQQKFDVVIALEVELIALSIKVIEHVADPEDFCKSLAALAKKDGLVFISTLNRSLPSFGLAIVAAEYILGWLPQGTHEWSKFLTPEELSSLLGHSGISVEDTSGMVYNPLRQEWSISGNTSVNYICYGVHRSL